MADLLWWRFVLDGLRPIAILLLFLVASFYSCCVDFVGAGYDEFGLAAVMFSHPWLYLLFGHEEAKCKAVKSSSAAGNPLRKIALPKCRPLPSSSLADLPFEVDCPGLAVKVSADSLMKAIASVSSPVQVIAGHLEMTLAPAIPRASALSVMVAAEVCDSLNGQQPKDVYYELVFEAPAGADQELPEKSGSGAEHPVDPSVVYPSDASPFKPLENAPSSKVVRFAPKILSDAQGSYHHSASEAPLSFTEMGQLMGPVFEFCCGEMCSLLSLGRRCWCDSSLFFIAHRGASKHGQTEWSSSGVRFNSLMVCPLPVEPTLVFEVGVMQLHVAPIWWNAVGASSILAIVFDGVVGWCSFIWNWITVPLHVSYCRLLMHLDAIHDNGGARIWPTPAGCLFATMSLVLLMLCPVDVLMQAGWLRDLLEDAAGSADLAFGVLLLRGLVPCCEVLLEHGQFNGVFSFLQWPKCRLLKLLCGIE
ncbi:hypothetical protein Nepgr_033583 [Nepenthes gracilis]|uniref:Uncharacterized protein n=1 Tax=Nepenthes gracilis TaxID=150966 RepID=A0AAD3Y8R8_NEPGR|nr:hypothetical protein Nepgr_033583 [Nepenthes gracilis]